ncbi:MAG: ATP-binding cassette domain-containing protein [Lachnospiraceae bacterium]|nr:ATP-binding cassette domain-containing protein [Lachnospiraceae bacterium]
MIKIKGLSKRFKEKVLFDNYNLDITDGEYVVLSGESGAGKTTLLNMIGGLEPVDCGSIVVNDIEVTKHKNRMKYYREVVGFLFQNFALVDRKTVRQNLMLVRCKSKNSVSIEEALKRVGLIDKLNTKVYKLSGGEQQRVALARLMVKNCQVILADEPTGSLDKKNSEIVMGILSELNKEGKTVVLVTHVEEYKQVGSRCIEL